MVLAVSCLEVVDVVLEVVLRMGVVRFDPRLDNLLGWRVDGDLLGRCVPWCEVGGASSQGSGSATDSASAHRHSKTDAVAEIAGASGRHHTQQDDVLEVCFNYAVIRCRRELRPTPTPTLPGYMCSRLVRINSIYKVFIRPVDRRAFRHGATPYEIFST